MPSSQKLRVFPSKTTLSEQVIQFIAQISAKAINQQGKFTIALSGGSMPKLLTGLASEPSIDWSAWHVFWADERMVPLDHPDSNFRSAQEHFLGTVTIPPHQIYPLDASLNTTEAAKAYQAKLAQVFQPTAGQMPRFDLILLGMGEDGHTASLFPNHPLLNETELWVAPIFDSPKPPPERITLTLPLINKAHQVAFITTGSGKAEALEQVFQTGEVDQVLPVGHIQPTDGELIWFVDTAAAERVSVDS